MQKGRIMPVVRKTWTRQQLLIAFNLYCKIPFGKLHSRNPEIIKYAEFIGRTPSALAMKLTNIASLDPAITSSGRKGLKGSSVVDRKMWDEMQGDWETFIVESEKAITNVMKIYEKDEFSVLPNYMGKNRVIQTTARVGTSFFRQAVLSAYNEKCCITGLSEPQLLVASHIIPWREDESNRLNPKNGLLLSMLHDKAFDLGIITINEDMTVRISTNNTTDDNYFNYSIRSYNGKKINLPEKFQPDSDFLAYHRDNIFKK